MDRIKNCHISDISQEVEMTSWTKAHLVRSPFSLCMYLVGFLEKFDFMQNIRMQRTFPQ